MSTFDIKPISEQDAFKLEVAKTDEAQLERSAESGPGDAAPTFSSESSPVNQAVEQIMSHWADVDEGAVHELADQTGDAKLKKIVGETAAKDLKPTEGMTGDFKADSEGPDEQIDLPPKLGGSDFGGGGGGGGGSGDGGGGGDGGDLLGLGPQDDGGMADPGDMPEAELPGFAMEEEGEAATYTGDGSGDADEEDEEEPPPPPPEDPNKNKKP